MLNEDVSQRNITLDSYRERITNFSNEFDLGLFLYIIKRSSVWIMLCIILSGAAAYLYLRYTAPTFKSGAILQIRESNNAQLVLEMNQFVEDKNLLADVELLRSKFFIDKALRKLPLEVSYFYKGQILTNELYTGTFFRIEDVEVLDPRVRDMPIFIDLKTEGKATFSYAVAGQPLTLTFDLNERITTPHFRCSVWLDDVAMMERMEADGSTFFRINSPSSLVAQYSKQIDARILDNDARTVAIDCRDANPVLARDLAEAMAETYIGYDVERMRESAESILRFIESQKDTVFDKLRESEYRMQAFKMENKVSDMSELTPIYLNRVREYEDRIVEVRVEMDLLSAIEQSTDKALGDIDVYNLMPLLVGTTYERSLTTMIESLQKLLLEREELFLEATPSNQAVRDVEHRIQVQKGLVVNSIRSLRSRLTDKVKEYEDIILQHEARFLTLPEKELEFARIDRLFQINEKYYTLLLEKDIEYRISRAGFVPDNKVLERPVIPAMPMAPNRNLVLFSYLLTGLVISFLIVLVRYVLHDNITSLNDIAKTSSASIGILGMIPKYKKEIPISQLLVDKNPKSLIAESFRTVRTNMQFVDNTPGPKLIAITSTISGEGKTFVAINLAGIIAFSGKRVIVLDLDMRKPKIHLGFGVDNIRGMSTLLINKDTLENCIQQSALENLYFITAGPIPPNPSELVRSVNA
ncbi:MAG: AAA family ATPase [Flavobacteriales bacterium]|nr:AAA family ATPase [Flavobacteriales bacterium]